MHDAALSGDNTSYSKQLSTGLMHHSQQELYQLDQEQRGFVSLSAAWKSYFAAIEPDSGCQTQTCVLTFLSPIACSETGLFSFCRHCLGVVF